MTVSNSAISNFCYWHILPSRVWVYFFPFDSLFFQMQNFYTRYRQLFWKCLYMYDQMYDYSCYKVIVILIFYLSLKKRVKLSSTECETYKFYQILNFVWKRCSFCICIIFRDNNIYNSRKYKLHEIKVVYTQKNTTIIMKILHGGKTLILLTFLFTIIIIVIVGKQN